MTTCAPTSTAEIETETKSGVGLVRGLSLLDSILLLVCGVIGSSVFLTAKDIAGPLPNPVSFLLVWIVGGAFSLFACFAFAELSSMFPQAGGQYVYLREAYGPLPAFLYGWMIFAVSNGGTIAALAVASATYLGAVVPPLSNEHVIFALGGFTFTRAHLVALTSIGVVTWINVTGLRRGALLQNVAMWGKLLAMVLFVSLGVTVGKGDWHHLTAHQYWTLSNIAALGPGKLVAAFGLALIAVFWAYDGWAYVTWVSGEVKNPSRNVPRALLFGMLFVIAIYVAMNVVYVYAMPISEIAKHETIARAAAVVLFSPGAALLLSAMISLSSFGAMATCILSGSRVYFAMAVDGVFFRRMAEIHPKWRTPAFSLIGQGVWAGVLAVSGRYDELYTYVMFMMVLSYTVTVLGLFVLRRKRPDMPRPYRCTGYPWLPAFYVIVGATWTLNTVFVRPVEALTGSFIVLLGVPGYVYWKRTLAR